MRRIQQIAAMYRHKGERGGKGSLGHREKGGGGEERERERRERERERERE